MYLRFRSLFLPKISNLRMYERFCLLFSKNDECTYDFAHFWLERASGWFRACMKLANVCGFLHTFHFGVFSCFIKMTNVWCVLHTFHFGVFSCFMKLTNVCIVLLTFRLGGFWCFMVLMYSSDCWILQHLNSEGQSVSWYLIAYVTILFV